MIDIFGEGPYLVGMSELAFGAVTELGSYFFHFTKAAIISYLFKHFVKGKFELGIALFLCVLQTIYVWSVSIKSEFFFSFSLAVLLVSELRILNIVPLRPLDYSFLFMVLFIPVRLFNSTSAVIGHLWIFWILFCAVYLDLKMELKKLKGKQFICYFLFIFLSLSMYLYEISILALHTMLAQLFKSNALAMAAAVTTASIFLLISAWIIKIKFQSRLEAWNHLGEKYEKIEHYFFFCSIFILFSFTLIYIPFTIMRMQNALVSLLLPILCLFFLTAQIPFIILLLHIALYRDEDTFHKWEQEGIASYYKELKNSMSHIQAIRHDIKNIFFTMGNFVERSHDEEMKHFFWEKIYTYSEKEMIQYELLSKIYQIPVESLRAFFFLKLSYAMQQNITVHLDISIMAQHFQTGMDIIDITRILGILIDNAVEEAAHTVNGVLEVKVIGNETGCSYIIKNTVTEQTQKNGITIGKTTKGAGHGNGLKIVQELLAQYHNVALNSFMKKSIYVQSLNILFQNQK